MVVPEHREMQSEEGSVLVSSVKPESCCLLIRCNAWASMAFKPEEMCLDNCHRGRDVFYCHLGSGWVTR